MTNLELSHSEQYCRRLVRKKNWDQIITKRGRSFYSLKFARNIGLWRYSETGEHVHVLHYRIAVAGANAMKRVAAGAHLLAPWLFEPVKCPEDRSDYCQDCSFLPRCKHQVLVCTLEWGAPQGRTVVRARPNEHYQRTGPLSNAD